jgi:hypothetical protein
LKREDESNLLIVDVFEKAKKRDWSAMVVISSRNLSINVEEEGILLPSVDAGLTISIGL